MHRPVNKLIHQFNERGLTLALAESATCGLATHQLSTVRGASNVLMGSVIWGVLLVKHFTGID